MNRNIVLYGAGKCGKEALEWFGQDNVELFIDNDSSKKGKLLYDKPTAQFFEFIDIYGDKYKKNTDIVISIESKWVVHQIAYELEKHGINIFSDVKRRWKSPAEYMGRNTEEYSCEHESVDRIRLAQNAWLLRHIEASKLSPAIGGLRNKQLKILSYTQNAFNEFKSQLGIKPIMEAGTFLAH